MLDMRVSLNCWMSIVARGVVVYSEMWRQAGSGSRMAEVSEERCPRSGPEKSVLSMWSSLTPKGDVSILRADGQNGNELSERRWLLCARIIRTQEGTKLLAIRRQAGTYCRTT